MRQLARKISKVILGVAVAAGVTLCGGVTAKADTVADAALLYTQQVALLEQYQNALAAQVQAALAAQYQAALTAQAGMQNIQANAWNQAYLMNAVQTMQLAQYQAMIQSQGLEHQDYLLEEFKESQVQAMQAFLGYNGL